MEPASIIGIVSGSATLIQLLGKGVLQVKDHFKGIKDVDESTRGLEAELDAFQFTLSVLDHELRQGSIRPDAGGFWNNNRLDALLSNATRTFSRMDAIFIDVCRPRGNLQQVRQYYRSSRYDSEVAHLRLRINTYLNSLSIPVLLRTIKSRNNPRSQDGQIGNMQLTVLAQKLEQLEATIGDLTRGLQGARTPGTPSSSNFTVPPPNLASDTKKDTEELVQLTDHIAKSVRSVTYTNSVRSTAETVRPADFMHPTAESVIDIENLSVNGLPLNSSSREVIGDWIQDVGSPTPSISGQPPEQPTGSQYTPANDAAGYNSVDLADELRKRRIEKGIELYKSEDFKGAIPHFRRALEEINEDATAPETESLILKQKLEFGLAYALFRMNVRDPEIETIVRPLLDNQEMDRADQSAWLLAEHLYHKSSPRIYTYSDINQNTLLESKSICLRVLTRRIRELDRSDNLTIMFIRLMVEICSKAKDSDAEIWKEMLPDEHEKPDARQRHSAGAQKVAKLEAMLRIRSVSTPNDTKKPSNSPKSRQLSGIRSIFTDRLR